ncbi:MAG: tetratricopeptide repeat protein [Candidatus Korobacteraceae bacterium]
MVKKSEGRAAKVAKPGAKPASPEKSPGFQQAVENYQQALKLLQERKFERAKVLFQKVISSGVLELADRAAVHLNTCNQHLARNNTTFKTPEEHYDYAVSLMNVGDFVGAREHLEKILKQMPKADYAWYGLGVLECLTGHLEDSLKALAEAVRLNRTNRFQARNDSDLKNLMDDPRFTELVYPEPELDSGVQ